MALRGDGDAIVATRAGDRMLVFAGGGTSAETGLIAHEDAAAPAIVGDLAMFRTDGGARVIDLADGRLGPAIPGLTPLTGGSPSVVPWAAGGAFVVALSAFSNADYDYHLDRLLVVDGTAAAPLPVPADLVDPRLLRPHGSRLYLRASPAGSDEPHLYGFDLAARAQVADALLPLCDEAAVLEERGCR